MIKVSSIIHKRLKKCDPSIASTMLQNIYLMNGDINNKEEINYVMLYTSMPLNIQAKKQNDKVSDSQDNVENNQPLLKI